jgi:SAM-dependent methyltransferase
MGFGQDNFILNVSRPIRVGYARALARLSGSDVAARRVMNLAKRFSKAFRKPRRVKRNYAAITLEERDIRSGAYKKYMPGGAAQWHQRGAFQFFFLKRMGLQASSRLLDVGCGPIRAGSHLIPYLNEGNYCGADYNKYFIAAARRIVEDGGLLGRRPLLEIIHNFDFSQIPVEFDFAIVFAVLNHCDELQRCDFFRNIEKPMKKGGRIYISHARWFRDSDLHGTHMKVSGRFGPDDFDVSGYGWERDKTFPIIELTVG